MTKRKVARKLTAPARTKDPRWRKQLHVGQAHLAPGMSLVRWLRILDRRDPQGKWPHVPTTVVDAVVADIAKVVVESKAKKKRGTK